MVLIIDQLAPFKHTLTALKTLDVTGMNQLWKVVTFCRSVRGNILVLRQRYLLRKSRGYILLNQQNLLPEIKFCSNATLCLILKVGKRDRLGQHHT